MWPNHAIPKLSTRSCPKTHSRRVQHWGIQTFHCPLLSKNLLNTSFSFSPLSQNVFLFILRWDWTFPNDAEQNTAMKAKEHWQCWKSMVFQCQSQSAVQVWGEGECAGWHTNPFAVPEKRENLHGHGCLSFLTCFLIAKQQNILSNAANHCGTGQATDQTAPLCSCSCSFSLCSCLCCSCHSSSHCQHENPHCNCLWCLEEHCLMDWWLPIWSAVRCQNQLIPTQTLSKWRLQPLSFHSARLMNPLSQAFPNAQSKQPT